MKGTVAALKRKVFCGRGGGGAVNTNSTGEGLQIKREKFIR